MQLNISQQMKMSQQMKLAPRMIQSMEILQLPIMALQERIEQELSENVVLEAGVGRRRRPELSTSNRSAPSTAAAEKRRRAERAGRRQAHNNEADFERLLEMSPEWPEDNSPQARSRRRNRIEEDGDRKHDVMANMAVAPAVAAGLPARAVRVSSTARRRSASSAST